MSSYKEESKRAKEVKRGNIELRPVAPKGKKSKKFVLYCWNTSSTEGEPFWFSLFGTEEKPEKLGAYPTEKAAQQALDKHKREWSNRGYVLEYKIVNKEKTNE